MGSRNPERDKPSYSERTRLVALERDYPDWALIVSCKGCVNGARFRWPYLIRLLGRRARIGDVLARLICVKCNCVRMSIKPVFVGKRRD